MQLLGVTRLGSFGAKARKHFDAHACFAPFVRHADAAHLSLVTRRKHTPTWAQIAAIGALFEWVGGPAGVAQSIVDSAGPGYRAMLAAHMAAVQLGVRVRADRLRDAKATVDAMDATTLAAKRVDVAAQCEAFMARPFHPPLRLFESVRSAAAQEPLVEPR